MTLLSVFGGGLFIIPLACFLGSTYCFYKGNKQWKSGSTWNEDTGIGPLIKHDSDERVRFLSIPAVKLGIALLILGIIISILMISDK